MAEFSYKAVTREGKLTNGRLEASDSRAVTMRIQGMGLIPISVEQSVAKSQQRRSFFQRIGPRDILFFTEELSTLVKAGLPLDRSLTITAELTSKPALRAVVQDILQQIKGGKSLAEALAAHPKHFSRLYVNMIRAGEAGGVLDTILERLAQFQRDADEMRGYLISALIYPALLTLVGIVSIAILLFFVIPRFATIFNDLGAPIPLSTQILLTISDWTLRYWTVALVCASAIVIWLRFWGRSAAGRRQSDKWKLH